MGEVADPVREKMRQTGRKLPALSGYTPSTTTSKRGVTCIIVTIFRRSLMEAPMPFNDPCGKHSSCKLSLRIRQTPDRRVEWWVANKVR